MSINPYYIALFIRLTRNKSQDHWRVTLENIHTGEKRHFSTEMELIQYLLKTTSLLDYGDDRLKGITEKLSD
ncbi:MAG: hypothetical protein AAF633_18335, partial [Chloroflexota bacterium]